MNSLIELVFSLKPAEIDNMLEIALISAFVGIYFTPLAIIIHDIWKRYEDKFLKMIFSLLAAFTLPVFIIPYVIFRKDTTAKEDKLINSEFNMLATTSNTIVCSHCKEINKANFNYCIRCGGKLLQTCKNCGLSIELNWKHCGYCGASALTSPREIQKIEVTATTPVQLKSVSTTRSDKILGIIGNKLNALITPTYESYR